MNAATRIEVAPELIQPPPFWLTWSFWLLMVVATLSAYLFTYDKLATTDSVLYAEGLKQMMAAAPQGWGAVGQTLADQFNGTLAVGYYLGVWWLHGLTEHLTNLVGLMNGLSAVFSVIGIGLFFWLTCRLTADAVVAFWAGLAILLAPSLWHLSHYGHPGIITIALFVASLICLDKLLVNARTTAARWRWGLAFWVLAFVAVAVRLDTVLAFGAFYGLLLLRRRLTVGNFIRLTLACLLMAGGLVLIRLSVFGTIMPATAAQKMAWQFAPVHVAGGQALMKAVIKNVVFWAIGLNILMAGLAAIGVFGLMWQKRWRLMLFLVAWVLPWVVFLPFRAIDAHRLMAGSLPPLCLLAMIFAAGLFGRRKQIALASVLVLAQVTGVLSYQVLVRHYPFQTRIEGRYLASVPLGFPPIDYVYRQHYLDKIHDVAEQVARFERGPVLIVDAKGSELFYRWYLRRRGRVRATTEYQCGPVNLAGFATPTNAFWFLNVSDPPPGSRPVDLALNCLQGLYDPFGLSGSGDVVQVHVTPFWTGFVHPPKKLFLDPDQVETLRAAGKKKAAGDTARPR
jgi:hypothetical protein